MSFSSLASETTTGGVTKIGGQMAPPASIYFGLTSTPEGRPTCSDHSTYDYVFDPNTEEGKALYSALMFAKATNKEIRVRGSGVCILNQPMESISYWAFKE